MICPLRRSETSKLLNLKLGRRGCITCIGQLAGWSSKSLLHQLGARLRGRTATYSVLRKGVVAEKGARFRGKWGLGAPPPPPPLSPGGWSSRTPPPPHPPFLLGVVFQEKGGGGGGPGVCTGNLGGGGRGRRGPIYRENEPPFRRKRLRLGFREGSGKGSGEGVRRRVLRRGPFSMGFYSKKKKRVPRRVLTKRVRPLRPAL